MLVVTLLPLSMAWAADEFNDKDFFVPDECANCNLYWHGIHSLRHSFATHLMEANVPLPVIQRLMGHARLTTTSKYLHVTSQHVASLRSPLELLRLPKPGELLE